MTSGDKTAFQRIRSSSVYKSAFYLINGHTLEESDTRTLLKEKKLAQLEAIEARRSKELKPASHTISKADQHKANLVALYNRQHKKDADHDLEDGTAASEDNGTKGNAKQRKLQEALRRIQAEKKDLENKSIERMAILDEAIDAYTHAPDLDKYVKDPPHHFVDQSRKWKTKNVREEEEDDDEGDEFVWNEKMESAYRNEHIPNPTWERENWKKGEEEEDDVSTLKMLKKASKFVPGMLHQYRGENRIYAFPPVLKDTKKSSPKKKEIDADGMVNNYVYDGNISNNAATNCSDSWLWDNKKEEYFIPESNSFRANNPLDKAYDPITTDVLENAIWKHQSHVERFYPQTELLPSKAEMEAEELKHSKAKQKEGRPIVKLKKSAINLSRIPVTLATNDPIIIRREEAKLMKKLQKGKIGRMEFDGLTKKLHDDTFFSEARERSRKKTDSILDGESLGGKQVHESMHESVHESKPSLISSITEPFIAMNTLTTMGNGGVFVKKKKTTTTGESSTPSKKAVLTNDGYLNDIDVKFNTMKNQLVDHANENNIKLTEEDIFNVGDTWTPDTKTIYAQRGLNGEYSMSDNRQKVSVKMERHRGAKKLDNKHISTSHRSLKDFALESSRTKSQRIISLNGKRELKESLAKSKNFLASMKEEAEVAAKERERERFRRGD